MLDRHFPGSEVATVFARDHLKDFAAQRLWHAIIRCELAPGETVSEAQLAARFGLGKAPIRAGLARISGTGLVIPIARQGYQVAPITLRTLGETAGMLRRLEPSLAEVRLDAGDFDRLSRLLAIAQAGVASTFHGTAEAVRQALGEIRQTILGGSGDTLLSRMLSEVWARADRVETFTRMLVAGAATSAARQSPQASVAVMSELVSALERRDPRTAERLLRRRVETWYRAMAEALLSCDLAVATVAGGIAPATGPRPE